MFLKFIYLKLYGDVVLFLLDQYLGVELLGLIKSAEEFSKVVVAFYTPISKVQEF